MKMEKFAKDLLQETVKIKPHRIQLSTLEIQLPQFDPSKSPSKKAPIDKEDMEFENEQLRQKLEDKEIQLDHLRRSKKGDKETINRLRFDFLKEIQNLREQIFLQERGTPPFKDPIDVRFFDVSTDIESDISEIIKEKVQTVAD